MSFIYDENAQYVLSLSYGKDSTACLGAIQKLGWPLHRVVTADVWATDTIPADLPPMVEFKSKLDEYIKSEFGIEVEHVCATQNGEKQTYEKLFYHIPVRKNAKGRFRGGAITGFPCHGTPWCSGALKRKALQQIRNNFGLSDTKRTMVYQRPQTSLSAEDLSKRSLAQGADRNIVQYLGIAADEPDRIARHTKPGVLLPLVELGWDESYCRQWCADRDLLSPIYSQSTRGGCWFCHNQDIASLRRLYSEYPELWEILLRWDTDSPTTFASRGITVHDYDKRFKAEEKGLVPTDRRFRWKMLEEIFT